MRTTNRIPVAFAMLIALTAGLKLAAPPADSAFGQVQAWAHTWISPTQG